MLGHGSLALLLLLGVAATASGAPGGACTLAKRAELPVTMIGLRPMVHASINGTDALFLADSGAFYSLLSPAAAVEFGLSLRSAPFGFVMNGVGGDSRTMLTTVKTFTLFNVPIPNVQFFVAGNDIGQGAVGLLGQNVLRVGGDVEYDLANGVIRLMRATDCPNTPLAYWATSLPYSVIDIEHATPLSPHTRGIAFVNGVKIRVMFDTGAYASVLTLDAAKRAGVTQDSAGVIATAASYGLGRRAVRTWIGPFRSFRIGNEEIQNTRLRISETLDMREVDMLVGADFFLSHRVYVSNSQRKLYFTYNGGPVFNLTSPAPATGGGPAPKDSTVPSAATPTSPVPESAAPADERSDQPGDAAGFSRRGAAFAARRDFEHAIADFTHACELDPNEASYLYQRGMAYWGNKQSDPALADFEQALKLKPDYVPALLAGAELHLQRKEDHEAVADLDAASRAAAKEADVRPQIGALYLRAGQSAGAVAQYTLWIESHPRDDVQMARMLELRCWSRGLWGQELDQALSDCDTALRSMPNSASVLDSQGLVQLRRGDYARAITATDRAVKLNSKDAWAHYIRAVAKMRKGLTSEAQADLVAATSLDANIAEHTRKLGITP